MTNYYCEDCKRNVGGKKDLLSFFIRWVGFSVLLAIMLFLFMIVILGLIGAIGVTSGNLFSFLSAIIGMLVVIDIGIPSIGFLAVILGLIIAYVKTQGKCPFCNCELYQTPKYDETPFKGYTEPRNEQRARLSEQPCQFCNSTRAEYYCPSCRKYVCRDCVKRIFINNRCPQCNNRLEPRVPLR